MIQVAPSQEQGHVVIAFSGSLDARSAEQLASVARQQPPRLHIIIDSSRASSVHDAALGRLVDALAGFRSHSIRGAGRHQALVLCYLGEELDEPFAPSRDDGAQR
jgi:anti-anti-sigma regulatory factor